MTTTLEQPTEVTDPFEAAKAEAEQRAADQKAGREATDAKRREDAKAHAAKMRENKRSADRVQRQAHYREQIELFKPEFYSLAAQMMSKNGWKLEAIVLGEEYAFWLTTEVGKSTDAMPKIGSGIMIAINKVFADLIAFYGGRLPANAFNGQKLEEVIALVRRAIGMRRADDNLKRQERQAAKQTQKPAQPTSTDSEIEPEESFPRTDQPTDTTPFNPVFSATVAADLEKKLAEAGMGNGSGSPKKAPTRKAPAKNRAPRVEAKDRHLTSVAS